VVVVVAVDLFLTSKDETGTEAPRASSGFLRVLLVGSSRRWTKDILSTELFLSCLLGLNNKSARLWRELLLRAHGVLPRVALEKNDDFFNVGPITLPIVLNSPDADYRPTFFQLAPNLSNTLALWRPKSDNT